MQLLNDDHLKFSDEHNRLLTAQVVLSDRMGKLAETMQALAVRQERTDARMDALIGVVDGLIRKPPSESISD